MMSRRESRVSMNARQNDALFEFESFKKKFLLANKHITKLNSTLSVRIEELNAQISTLYTENLRLRASEINLAAQLKRERDKSRKIIAATEAAALGLTKHLNHLRQSFSIPDEASSSSSSPTPPRATQRPVPSTESLNSPAFPRLSRAPTISLIYEDEEPSDPTEDEDDENVKSPSTRRKNGKPKRLSASRLPLPARVSSPPPVIAQIAKRKPFRRQSGLLVRQGSPVLGSTEAEDEDEKAVVLDGPEEKEEPVVAKKEKRKSSKDKGKEKEKEHDISLRKKLRDQIGDEGKKLKFTDVTNSPRSRPSQPVDPVLSEVELTTHTTHEYLSSSSSRSSPNSYLPTPQSSSSPPQVPATESPPDMELTGGRERRVRKSVNYAEPKLNTKMRKPDPSDPTSRKRKSASAILTTRSEVEAIAGYSGRGYHRADTDTDGAKDDMGTETDDGGRSSLEGLPSRVKSRVADPVQVPLPPASTPGLSSSSDIPSSSSSSSSTMPLRRAKSRSSYLHAEDDASSNSESDDADTEYAPSSRSSSSWVNMSERKKGHGKRVAGVSGSSAGKHGHEDDVERRHSSAV